MSRLLKAGDARMDSSVRPLAVACAARLHTSPVPAPTFTEPPAAEEALDRQCIELEATIADLRHRIAQMEEEADHREDAAFERGKQDGLDHVAGEESRRLELLSASLAKLQADNAKIISECEILAVQLARTALGRIFGDETLHAELVGETLAHHLALIQQDLVRRVRVSPRDFHSPEDLAALSDRLPGISVITDQTLVSGECAADLMLGTLDTGLSGQWKRLSQFFDRLTEEEAAS
ncbi:hypothetical protein SZ64_09095 [Erythrobacter sp. SG61-1L]|uniref:hypothetical protein n=1 Tax=Erythrobacter sp. SG61-1L TaxID=1603897 RepID=UPI0006C928BE|nr:hypothetical protein [Erythrobacter sp. SG61-1L]KPL68262.1 hypothetical protein SZ64_09095 [Erythrobacter sp. SG61-1L]